MWQEALFTSTLGLVAVAIANPVIMPPQLRSCRQMRAILAEVWVAMLAAWVHVEQVRAKEDSKRLGPALETERRKASAYQREVHCREAHLHLADAAPAVARVLPKMLAAALHAGRQAAVNRARAAIKQLSTCTSASPSTALALVRG